MSGDSLPGEGEVEGNLKDSLPREGEVEGPQGSHLCAGSKVPLNASMGQPNNSKLPCSKDVYNVVCT